MKGVIIMQSNTSSDKRKRRMIIEIIIAIIVLLLITSCTAFNLFGKIGKNSIETNTDIDDSKKDIPKNINDKLFFDMNNNSIMKVNLEDGFFKISYSIEGINIKDLVCTTSDASIATCIIKDGYIEVHPKKKGKVIIELSSKVNGIKYIAKTTIEIVSREDKTLDDIKGSGSSKPIKQGITDQIENPNEDININKSNDARLKSLFVGRYDLNPSFDKDKFEYVVNILNNVDVINIKAETLHKKAKIISGTGNVELNSKSTLHEIKVKADDGTILTYTIKINKLESLDNISSDATLKTLILDGYTLNPDFISDEELYSIKVPYNLTDLDVLAIPNISTSLVMISGNKRLKVGNNLVKIKVTAEDGTEKIYKVNVERLRDEFDDINAYLSNLVVSNGVLKEIFEKQKYLYNVEVESNIDSLDLSATTDDPTSTFEIIGNNNLKVGVNKVYIKVTSKDGIKKTYEINVAKKDVPDTTEYYINSIKEFTVGLRDNNYKNIIINSNILSGNITSNYQNGTLTLTDQASSIILESNTLNLSYLLDQSQTSHTIKVDYNTVGIHKIKVKGIKAGVLIDEYEIVFNVKKEFIVKIYANGGFFSEFEDTYELLFKDGERLDLTEYNTAYKRSEIKCKVYTLKEYNTESDGSGNRYNLDMNNIKITSDLDLYAIYDETGTINYISTSNKLYLADVDIFTLENGVKGFIYPGANGAYIMHIKNTTESKITLKSMDIEEDSICTDNVCLNMGYIVKYTNNSINSYNYLFGNETTYAILNDEADSTKNNNDGTYHNKKTVFIDDIELQPNEETEISLLWKWVDSESDTKIGKYSGSNTDDTFYLLTVSYTYDKEEEVCE